VRRVFAFVVASLTVVGASALAQVKLPQAPAPGARGGIGLALVAKKALTVPPEGPQFIDDAVLLVKDGKIEAIGTRAETPIPAGYQVVDLGSRWIMPGMIDLHSHVAGTFDINDMVYLCNPGLRVSCSVIPANERFKLALAAGVTTVLYIPGSGVNMSGQGVLLKTGLDRYEEAVIRNPGSLKIAQAGNPEGWTVGIGRSFMNFDLREVLRRGKAYAERWKAYEEKNGPVASGADAKKGSDAKKTADAPEKNFDLEIFRALLDKKAQISTHTQIFQVVLMTLTMLRQEFGFDVYIDHGEMAGYKLAGLARDLGVPVISGPREVEVPTRQFINWTGSNPEAILGIAAEYQKGGVKMLGFNTDAPVVPAEELAVQATVSVHYGLDDSQVESGRGLTIVPALTAGIASRVGSLEVGKDADVLVVTGDPIDPRNTVERVFIDGRAIYDIAKEKRRW
jgi:imidazolonepropionase-like amidohydrolase